MNIDRLPMEEFVDKLIREEIDINELNLAKLNHRQAFIGALEKRPFLLRKIKEVYSEHFLKYAIKEMPQLFLYLKKEQYTDFLAQIFIKSRLTNDIARRGNKGQGENKQDFSIATSLDNKVILNYSYATPKEDEFYYFDNEFQIPISVRANIKATLKIDNAVKLINRLDTDVKELGENKIINMLDETIVSSFKAFFNSYINKQKVNFYGLCASLQELEQSFRRELNDEFKSYGIEVCNFVIKKIAIPEDLQRKIEDLAFEIRQRRAEVEADAEFAKNSLDMYEQKLAVEEKYPNATPSLTEYEKDLALKRYLIKHGKLSKEELDHTINLKAEKQKTDASLSKKKDIVPEIEKKKNVFKTTFIALLVSSILLNIIAMVFSVYNIGVGFFIFAGLTAIFGTVAAFNYSKFKDEELELPKGDLSEDGKHESESSDESSSN